MIAGSGVPYEDARKEGYVALRNERPQSFFERVVRASPLYGSLEVVRRLDMLEPETCRRVLLLVRAARDLGVMLAISETYRSRERQQALYRARVTQLKDIGTHHFGLACDLVCVEDGLPNWDADYAFLGALARAHGMIWGGDWGGDPASATLVDATHVQRCAVVDQPALFAGAWYPDAEYQPYLRPATPEATARHRWAWARP